MHHPFGPSILSFYEKCSAFVPFEGSDQSKAESGSLRHGVVHSRDFDLLGGDVRARQEVEEAIHYLERLVAENHFDPKYEFYEQYLELKGVNFGTCDYLCFSRDGRAALLLDLKFGAWSVKPARDNLQLLNYVAAAFENYPGLQRILGAIWQVGGRTSTHWFNRKYLTRYLKRIRAIVEAATRARDEPVLSDFHPDPVNCSFCSRLGCPARVQLASALVSAWVKTPIKISQPFSLTRVDLDTLTALKRLCGALVTFAEAVSNECKRRVFDEGVILEGYEIRERSGKRTLTGEHKVETAIAVLANLWRERYPDQPLDVPDIILGIVELSVADIEKQLGRHAPKGQTIAFQRAVGEALEKSGLVEAVPQYFLAAVKT